MSRLFGPIRQNGYIVRDIEAAMQHWITVHGIGPWFYVDRVQTDYFRYRGKDSPMEMSVALANSGDLQLELIQQRNDAPSMYMDFLNAGNEGLQHVAYWSLDFQRDHDRLLGMGYAVVHEGSIGGPQGRFAYFDREDHPGSVLELSDVSGPKGKTFEMIRQAGLAWDGNDPIRRR